MTTEASWREPVLAQFPVELARVVPITVVADPDRILAEPGFVETLAGRGFELQEYGDPIAFRYLFERRWRDGEGASKPSLVLRVSSGTVDQVPFDILAGARQNQRVLSIGIAALFPKLDPRVVTELPKEYLDTLARAHQIYVEEEMGENATRDFILRHVYEVVPELVKSVPDVLNLLLQLHQSRRSLPTEFVTRLTRLLGDRWKAWPLEQLLMSRPVFLEFLQERWAVFLRNVFAGIPDSADVSASDANLRISGPALLPFDDPKVWVHVDSLFLEGQLKASSALPASQARGKWFAVGVSSDEKNDQAERLRRLRDVFQSNIPGSSASPQEWMRAALQWAELQALGYAAASNVPHALGDLDALRGDVATNFGAWLEKQYASLYSLTFLPTPPMLHHVPRWMAHQLAARSDRKLALVVVDGLSLSQWSAVRQTLNDDISIEEGATFAWVPTMTSVSRQALFSGEAPVFFASSIATTSKEEQRWTLFWEGRGLRRSEVAYLKQQASEDEGQLADRIGATVADGNVRVIGIVVSKVDEIMHGCATGMDGLHAAIRHWAGKSGLNVLVRRLLEFGFDVVLTSDHGNAEAVGAGRPNVGVTAEERGERALVFSTVELRDAASAQAPRATIWPGVGLPEDYLCLLAPDGEAFVTEGAVCVAHGGASIDEVVVPFVRMERRK